jgi:hypothetical protein
MAACTLLKAPVGVLIPLAVVAGSLAGAAHGFLRAELGSLVRLSQMPRALGIVSTLNELTYVLAPVFVSFIGFISPALAILAVALLTALPAMLAPPLNLSGAEPEHTSEGRIHSFWILFWLTCSAIGGASVGTIEIGAVALALQFDFKPELAILFTVPLCLASVASGLWVSWRNHEATMQEIFFQLLLMACGAVLAALQISVWAQVLSCILIGSAIAPIATFYSLTLERLAPKNRHPEVFALLRTSNAVGVIFASATIAFWSLSAALTVIATLMAAMVVTVGYVAAAYRK